MNELTPAQIKMAKAMPEAMLEQHVADACRVMRLDRYHTLRSKGSAPGWPDDVIMGPGGIIYRELKREGMDPTERQRHWLDGLAAHGHDVGVWRPSDWLSGRIMDELRALSTRR